MDDPSRADEGRQGTPRAAVGRGASDRRDNAPNPPRRFCVPRRQDRTAALQHGALDAVAAHGFRSSFRDWAAERTTFPAEVAEMALAHTVADKVEAAYRRGDLFQKRRQLAEAWATFCDVPAIGGEVV